MSNTSHKRKIFTLPNIISFFRILLVPVFLYVYHMDIQSKSLYLGAILIVSGISDMADGRIARKFDMVSELGKVLDPIADKLTQLSLLLCLLTKYAVARIVFGIFLTKEILVAAVGYKVIRMQGKNEGAKWYGKVSTVIFYVVTIVLVIFDGISEVCANALLMTSGAAIIAAFCGYMLLFRKILSGK